MISHGPQEPVGSAFLDANYLVSCVMSTDRFNRPALDLLARLLPSVRSGETQLFTSPRALEEVVWACWRILHDQEQGRGSFSALSQAERLTQLAVHRERLEGVKHLLLSGTAPYTVADLTSSDFAVGMDIALAHAIPLPDALHIAMAQRLCNGRIVTNDRHMRSIPEVTCITYGLPAE